MHRGVIAVAIPTRRISAAVGQKKQVFGSSITAVTGPDIRVHHTQGAG
jgi:hypothetical protein